MLTTAVKAPLIVHTAAGVFVEANSQVLTFAPEGVAAVEGAVAVPNVGTCWYIAGLTVGSTALTIVGGGSSVTITVDVGAAPLVAVLGDAVPR